MVEKLKDINFKKIFIIYLLLQPVLDLLTSLCVRYLNPSFTFGIFFRSIFLVFIVIYSFAISNKKERKYQLIYLGMLAIYIILFFVNTFIKYNSNLLFLSIKSIIKTFYLPVTLISLINIVKKGEIENKHLIYVLLEYVGLLTIGDLSGLAFNSYANGSRYGKNGWFYAANEIGAILCLLIPYLMYELIKIKDFKNNKLYLVILLITYICSIFSSLNMGTKVPFIGLILAISLTSLICFVCILRKKYVKGNLIKLVATILSLVFIMGIFTHMPIGKNMQTTVDKIIAIVVKDDQNKKTNENANEIKTEKSKRVKNVIVNNRNTLLKNAKSEYNNSSFADKLLGIGYQTVDNGVYKERKLAEIDYYDILINTGIIGCIMFFIPLFYYAIHIIIKLFKYKKKMFNMSFWLNLYVIFISLVVAKLSGHILTAPAVCIYFAIACSRLYTATLESKS